MFKTITNVHEQLPFFTCVNHLLETEIQKEVIKSERESQKDINKMTMDQQRKNEKNILK